MSAVPERYLRLVDVKGKLWPALVFATPEQFSKVIVANHIEDQFGQVRHALTLRNLEGCLRDEMGLESKPVGILLGAKKQLVVHEQALREAKCFYTYIHRIMPEIPSNPELRNAAEEARNLLCNLQIDPDLAEPRQVSQPAAMPRQETPASFPIITGESDVRKQPAAPTRIFPHQNFHPDDDKENVVPPVTQADAPTSPVQGLEHVGRESEDKDSIPQDDDEGYDRPDTPTVIAESIGDSKLLEEEQQEVSADAPTPKPRKLLKSANGGNSEKTSISNKKSRGPGKSAMKQIRRSPREVTEKKKVNFPEVLEEELKAYAVPSVKEVLPVLLKLKYSCFGKTWFRPGYKNKDKKNLICGEHYFESILDLRRFLCLRGVETKGFEKISETSKAALKKWVRYSIVPSLRSASEIPLEAREPLSSIASFLKDLGFHYTGGYYYFPGEKKKDAGGISLNGYNLDGSEGLCSILCRQGLPETCNFSRVSEVDRIRVELYLSDCKSVNTFEFAKSEAEIKTHKPACNTPEAKKITERPDSRVLSEEKPEPLVRLETPGAQTIEADLPSVDTTSIAAESVSATVVTAGSSSTSADYKSTMEEEQTPVDENRRMEVDNILNKENEDFEEADSFLPITQAEPEENLTNLSTDPKSFTSSPIEPQATSYEGMNPRPSPSQTPHPSKELFPETPAEVEVKRKRLEMEEPLENTEPTSSSEDGSNIETSPTLEKMDIDLEKPVMKEDGSLDLDDFLDNESCRGVFQGNMEERNESECVQVANDKADDSAYEKWFSLMKKWIKPDASWAEVESQMMVTPGGITYNPGIKLTDWEYTFPGRKPRASGGIQDLDFVTDMFQLKNLAFESFGWRGDNEFHKEKEMKEAANKNRRPKRMRDSFAEIPPQKNRFPVDMNKPRKRTTASTHFSPLVVAKTLTTPEKKDTTGEKLKSCKRLLSAAGRSHKKLSCGDDLQSNFHRSVEEINRFLVGAVSSEGRHGDAEGTKPILYICGSPGVGKTSAVKWCCSQVLKDFKDDICGVEGPHIEHLNGASSATSGKGLIEDLVDAFKIEAKTMQGLTSFVKKTKSMNILIIDEIDHLVADRGEKDNSMNQCEKILHDLCILACDASVKFALIGISNAVNNAQSRRLRSIGLDGKRVLFSPYSEIDLVNVVVDRIGSTIIEEKALSFAAKKVSSSSGDARKMMELITGAVEECYNSLTEEQLKAKKLEKPVVTIRHVMASVKATACTAVTEAIESLPDMQRLVLCVAVCVCRIVSTGRISLNSLRRYCSMVSQEQTNQSIDPEDFLLYVQRLVDEGLIIFDDGSETNINSKGMVAALKSRIHFGQQLQDVESAIVDKLSENHAYARLIRFVEKHPPSGD